MTLHEHLQNPATLTAIIAPLSQSDQRALNALLHAGGSLPSYQFEQHFGGIRTYRPWRKDQTVYEGESSEKYVPYLAQLHHHPLLERQRRASHHPHRHSLPHRRTDLCQLPHRLLPSTPR
ncbi:MAG: hypothetical protein AAF702_19460 [Chloroflexota bacterium]